ncbi:serine/threonine protein kinase [Polyangium spumosum]|uniref:Serine/threonine protein kinase n=1 Tax=Polyangium spumosum TaxID=889282 RepID=A0A6N7PMZ5_9BACT|nr:serine/threonine protein kinase [Polyangium spumosum]
MRFRPAAIALFALLFASGCRPFEPATPPGFVELEDRYGRSEYRATTADGVVLGVRAFDNEPKGERAFWVRAIENRLRDMGGYALLEKREVKDRAGLTGTQLRFGHDEGGEPYLYYLTIFVTDDRVFVLEAGGARPQMQRLAEQIDWSVKNFLHH